MKSIRTQAALVTFAITLSLDAFGLGAILQLQGEKGDREAFFADVRVISDRTPMNQIFGPISVREIDVTAVYEHAAKPEWVTMRLQFECPSEVAEALGGKPAKPMKATDPVRFRIGPGSYLVRRVDLKPQDMPETDWNESSAPMLMRAARIACNDIEFDKAMRATVNTKAKTFDEAAFGKRIAKLGLPPDLMMIGQATADEFLDFAWTSLWWEVVLDGKRPDPSGKWSTLASVADKEAAAKKLEEMRKQAAPALEAAKKSLEANLAKMDAEFAFQDRASELRGGRKLNKFEVHLVNTWVGLPEDAVVTKMGNPMLNEAGKQRFLKYTKVFDNTAQVVNLASGATWEEGNYSECNVEFVTTPDQKGEWRVADARVWVRENAMGSGQAWCYGFLKTPD
jgi:hypothetical protein